jgi:phosphatidylglycerophosphate synthase
MTWAELRKKCQRESDYIITLLFTNEVSLITTWLLLRSSVTPNQVTIASILCALLCGIFYAFGMFLWGSFFLFISHMLDCTDGNLARAKEVFSPFGRWIDFIGNRTGEVFIFLGVTFYFYGTENPDFWIIFTLMGSIFLLLYYYIVDIALSLKVSDPKQKITSISFKGVHVKWGIMEPVLYGFIVFSSMGLIKVQILFILFLTIGGLIYQAYKNYCLFKSSS